MYYTKILFVLTLSTSILPTVMADYDYDDSPEFPLDLLTFPLGGAYDYADSSQFSLDLYPVNRGWAESSTFSYDWLANCNPVFGPFQYAGEFPDNNFLKQLVNDQWSSQLTIPLPGETVIIINHGWNSWPEGMLDLAVQIASEIPDAFIYSWEWGDGPDAVSDANPNGKDSIEDFLPLTSCAVSRVLCLLSAEDLILEVAITKKNAHDHGRQLGDVLVDLQILPSTHNIHMIGHSFGGVVCAEAAKKLHENTGSQVKQLTTLDTPTLLWPYAIGAVNPDNFERVEVIYYDELLPLAGTGGPIWWNTDNVMNLHLNPFYYIFPLHTKVVDWYTRSADSTQLDCENNPYGFGWSFAYSPGDPYWDITGYQRELEVGGQGCLMTWSEAAQAAANAVVDAVKEDFVSAAEWTGNKAEVVMDNIGNVINSSVKLTVTTSIVLPMGESQFVAMANGSPAEPNEAYIYRQIDVPVDAEQVVFDMRFETVGIGDVLTLSIDDQVLITIDVESAGESDTYSMSYPASIKEYAGQNVLLQIMLRPTGEGTTSVLIDNLGFIKLTVPGDFDGDRIVSIIDLKIMTEQWLINPADPVTDIAPPEGDNMVNFNDFRVLADNWNIDLADPNTF